MAGKKAQERERVQRWVARLAGAERQTFPAYGLVTDVPQKQGVYVISTRRGVVMHVGRTYRAKGGLRQRLNDHLRRRSSYVNQYHEGDPSRLREREQYAYVVIDGAGSERLRALVEHAAVGHLCPQHLGRHLQS